MMKSDVGVGKLSTKGRTNCSVVLYGFLTIGRGNDDHRLIGCAYPRLSSQIRTSLLLAEVRIMHSSYGRNTRP